MRLGLALALALARPASAQEWIRLDLPPAELLAIGDRCPIRVVLPLAGLWSTKEGKPWRTARAAPVTCHEARLSTMELTLTRAKAPSTRARLHIASFVALRQGRDRAVDLAYSLVRGETVLGTARRSLNADEGELNWEDGVDLFFPASELDGKDGLELRIEATVAER